MNDNDIVFIDLEVNLSDIGALYNDGRTFHSTSKQDFVKFLRGARYAVGHNLFHHDYKYVSDCFKAASVDKFIDTLLISPLLFPQKQYHSLIKEYKFTCDDVNNPVNDCKICKELFDLEADRFRALDERLKSIYYGLLGNKTEFKDFFDCVGYAVRPVDTAFEIAEYFAGKICSNARIKRLSEKYPVELAYALAAVAADEKSSLTPPWVLMNYPKVENTLYELRGRRCAGCSYCRSFNDETAALKEYFGYPGFRLYDGRPLQQEAVRLALENKWLLAVFPTGGGKSITFQLPALMAYRAVKGLTVVISPLQSLMKDQVDNLADKGITQAATINGQIDSVQAAGERRRVEDGDVAILYISPESLRSKSMLTLLLKRNVVRFVIDEAHCFSVWGQDFRTDYQYIGDFIREYRQLKNAAEDIPVSCFTATAKKRVIDDIMNYFKNKLNMDLVCCSAKAARTNLNYHVLFVQESDKFDRLLSLLDCSDKPVIIYVSRTKKAESLAEKLCGRGYTALAYHGKMDNDDKVRSQEAFMKDEARIIVATTAFGMGVDKKDVGMVVHYDISDSLENYVQEAGRAGRDENIIADCFILFNEEDLDSHFMLLNHNKISEKEISQVWRAIRNETKKSSRATLSALEIARGAGWNDAERDIETRVKTAVNELEQSGFIRRGQNASRVFATSIAVKNMTEASEIISKCGLFDGKDGKSARSIIKSLISARSIANAQNAEAESRIDYLSDNLGIERGEVVRLINLMKQAGILKNGNDMTAYVRPGNREGGQKLLDKLHAVEEAVIDATGDKPRELNLKAFYQDLSQRLGGVTMNEIKALLNFLKIKKQIDYNYKTMGENYSRNDYIVIKSELSADSLRAKAAKRWTAAKKILAFLYDKCGSGSDKEQAVEFSRVQLIENHKNDLQREQISMEEADDALLYLLKMRILKIEGEFFVVYNRMIIERLSDLKDKYGSKHYCRLQEYYKSRTQQIHIVGEYARKLLESKEDAEFFTYDYFHEDNDLFLKKYFSGRLDEIKRNMTKQKYDKLFGKLSEAQLKIIRDDKSKYIVVAAGPGSGKTMLLSHKLASLVISENVKHEQMIMLTFSRAAATVFKKRLKELIGGTANYIAVSTFHSYCFDLLGKVGTLAGSEGAVKDAVQAIKEGTADQNKTGKLVMVIDEAQDINDDEFSLIKLLTEVNEEMRVIAVGDDDQSIYGFRKASPEYLRALGTLDGAATYELSENFRGRANLVEYADRFIEQLPGRLKKNPVKAHTEENGILRVIKYSASDLSAAAAQNVIDTLNRLPLTGETAVLAFSNTEVFVMGALLEQNGKHVKYVTRSACAVSDLVETRRFYDLLGMEEENSLIDDELWNRAKSSLRNEFTRSAILPVLLTALYEFDEIKGNYRYKNDLAAFLSESPPENFVKATSADVFVSTVHQAKGRQFDNVFLTVNKKYELNDDIMRVYYVGMTRAANNLFINTDADFLDGVRVKDMTFETCGKNFALPAEIPLRANMKEVYLDAAYDFQKETDRLTSGDRLEADENGCYFGGKPVVRFASKFQNQLSSFRDKGYVPYRAEVYAVVYWTKKDEQFGNANLAGKEIKIVLPVVYLKREF